MCGRMSDGYANMDLAVLRESAIPDGWREVAQLATTGEKPGKGTYVCTACGQRVVLDDSSDTLPPCPKCDGANFRKIS